MTRTLIYQSPNDDTLYYVAGEENGNVRIVATIRMTRTEMLNLAATSGLEVITTAVA